MKVRLNEFARQWELVQGDALAAMAGVGASGWYVLGPEVSSFETALAAHCGTGHAVGVGNGLDALEICLRCAGVSTGDRVLTTPLSAFATTLAIIRVGAVPVFADVDSAGLLDLEQCERLLERQAGIRYLLPVHLYGHAMDLDALAALARQREITVIEDCAQAIGARWRGRPVGSASALAAVSFYPTKNLGALGDAGAVLTESTAHAERARRLRHYGQAGTYDHVEIGLNSRLDELHAAVLLRALLPRLASFTSRRREIAEQYRKEIRSVHLRLPSPPTDSESVWHLFPVLVAPGRRDDFVRHLRERGIESGAHYPRPIPEQGALRQYGAFEVAGELRRARDFAANEVSLPVHPHLTADEVDHVASACNAWRPG